VTRVWLPAVLIHETPFQKTLSNDFHITAEGGTPRIVKGKTDALGIVAAEFPAGVKPVLTLTIAGSQRKTTQSISPRPAKPHMRIEPSLSIFCGRQSSCPPTAS